MPASEAPAPRLLEIAPALRAVEIPSGRSRWLAEALPVRAYLLGEDRPGAPVALVDTGYDDPASVAAIEAAIGERTVEVICLTHRHPDHGGGARALAARYGARVLAHPAEATSFGAAPGLDPEPVAPGDTVEIGALSLVAIASPGHSRGHLAWHVPTRGWLFTGDAILGAGSVLIAPPDGDLAAYLDSLARLERLDPLERILPGHGPPVDAPQAALRALAAHRRHRLDQVHAALKAGPLAPDDLVRRIYEGEIPEDLLPLARLSLESSLRYLEAGGKIVRDHGCARRLR